MGALARGTLVRYDPRGVGHRHEHGLVVRYSTSGTWVYVLFGNGQEAKACRPEDLVVVVDALSPTVGQVREWITPDEQKRLEAITEPHPFEGGVGDYFSPSCTRMVLRADFGEDCGLPARSRIHDDPNEGIDPEEPGWTRLS